MIKTLDGSWSIFAINIYSREYNLPIGIKMTEIKRADIKIGARVRITLKKDQGSSKLTEGTVKDILTNSPTHPHGIKVRLADGQVGRVKELA